MGNGSAKTNEFTTSLETVEFSSEKLDSMLFEIPLGYALATNESELENKFNMKEMKDYYKNQDNKPNTQLMTEQKETGTIRIGVYEPKGGDGQLQTSELQQHLVGSLKDGAVEAIAPAPAPIITGSGYR